MQCSIYQTITPVVLYPTTKVQKLNGINNLLAAFIAIS